MSRIEKKYHFIYKTTDIRNGNFYIGMHSTNDLNDGYVGSGKRLKHLIYKHGKKIFNMEILEFLPNRKSLRERESEIVNSDLLLEDKCMNLKPGGDGGFNNDEHQLKCSQAAGKKHSIRLLTDEEYRDAYSEKLSKSGKNRHNKGNLKNFIDKGKTLWQGRTHSEETKKKMSEDRKNKYGLGESNSSYGSKWMTKNGISKKISKNDIQTFVNDGWSFGRIVK
jgi:hypothetical protein